MLQEITRKSGPAPDEGMPVTPGPSRQALAQIIRNFLSRTGMSQTRFGIVAAQDDKILWRLEHAPRGISMDKADRIHAYIEAYDMQKHENGHQSHNRKQKTPSEGPGS